MTQAIRLFYDARGRSGSAPSVAPVSHRREASAPTLGAAQRNSRPAPSRSAWLQCLADAVATPSLLRPLLRNLHQAHGVDEAVGEHEIAILRDVSVAHDVASTGNRPTLELLGFRIEPHDCVRLGFGFAVPDNTFDGGDAIGSGLRPAR